MICVNCGKPIEKEYVEYKGHYFCGDDNDECLKEWLYSQTEGECYRGEIEQEVAPSWSEEYLNTLGMSLKDF